MTRFVAAPMLMLLLMFLLGTGAARAEIKWEVVKTLPHDTSAFTQGLFIADGLLYEATGQIGRSELRAMRLSDGKLLRRKPIRADLFGEGAAPWGEQMVTVTWRHGLGFVWRRKDFKQLGSFRYEGEGWGLTSDGKALILSDGTPTLRRLDPVSFKETGRVTVTRNGKPIGNLNELEYVDGAIYANVWYTSLIVKIDPASGAILDYINLAPLAARHVGGDRDAVLNGIAWNPTTRLLYVTGKNWPSIYALKLAE